MKALAALAALVVLAAAPAAAAPDGTVAANVPVSTLRLRAFDFGAGRTAPVKLAYRTLGTVHRDPAGRVDDAVVLLHGTGGSGAAFLGPKAPLLFGSGAPLDLATTFVVIPDAVGMGASSKPSDGLGVNFPHYDYADIVAGIRAVLADLKVTRVRAVIGVSMGAMVGWTWAEAFPEEIGTLVAMGAWPTAVTGRNLLWRLAARDALLANPTPGGAGARAAAAMTMVGNVPPALLAKAAPDAATAQALLDARATAAGDPVDLAFALDAVRTYAPQGRLAAITATVIELNFADDILYPPADAPPLPPRFTRIVVPASSATSGHATLGAPAVWLPLVAPAITQALAKR